jgi:hypothetical protein
MALCFLSGSYRKDIFPRDQRDFGCDYLDSDFRIEAMTATNRCKKSRKLERFQKLCAR